LVGCTRITGTKEFDASTTQCSRNQCHSWEHKSKPWFVAVSRARSCESAPLLRWWSGLLGTRVAIRSHSRSESQIALARPVESPTMVPKACPAAGHSKRTSNSRARIEARQRCLSCSDCSGWPRLLSDEENSQCLPGSAVKITRLFRDRALKQVAVVSAARQRRRRLNRQ